MGRRALFWSGAVLAGLVLQQVAVRLFGPGANRWLGMALLIAVLLSVLVIVFSPDKAATARSLAGGGHDRGAGGDRPRGRADHPLRARELVVREDSS